MTSDASTPLSEQGVVAPWARKFPATLARDFYYDVVLRLIRMIFAPLTIKGAENLDDVETPVVVVANHCSHIDTTLIAMTLPRAIRRRMVIAAAADYFFTGKVSTVFNTVCTGAFPVERTRVSRVGLESCQMMLDEGSALLIFPEGGRSTNGELTEFKPGAAWIARRAVVPVLPLHIQGSFDILPKGRVFPRRRPVTVSVGELLYPREGESAKDFNLRIEDAVKKLS